MHYVLMIFFLHGYGARTTVVMQEFDSEKACLVAVNEVRGTFHRENAASLLKAVCTPKG
jgi:predicted esterase